MYDQGFVSPIWTVKNKYQNSFCIQDIHSQLQKNSQMSLLKRDIADNTRLNLWYTYVWIMLAHLSYLNQTGMGTQVKSKEHL